MNINRCLSLILLRLLRPHHCIKMLFTEATHNQYSRFLFFFLSICLFELWAGGGHRERLREALYLLVLLPMPTISGAEPGARNHIQITQISGRKSNPQMRVRINPMSFDMVSGHTTAWFSLLCHNALPSIDCFSKVLKSNWTNWSQCHPALPCEKLQQTLLPQHPTHLAQNRVIASYTFTFHNAYRT